MKLGHNFINSSHYLSKKCVSKENDYMKSNKEKEIKPVSKLVIKVLAEAIVEQMLYEASMGVKTNQAYMRVR